MESGGLMVLYFPYIDMEEGPLREIVLYFNRITFLRPSFWVPSVLTERLQTEGIVESKAPIRWDLDNVQVKRMLNEFESLIALYQDSGYLEYLKYGTLPFQDDERCHQIVSEIRRYEEKARPDDMAEEKVVDCLRGQLLLQLAQELERQRQELLGLYQEISDKESDVVASLVGEFEEGDGDGQISGALKPEEDDFLIAERLRAWNEMYQMIDREEFQLFTDNQCVVQYLADGLEAIDEAEPSDQMIEEIAMITLPAFRPGPIEEYLRARETIRRLPEWRGFEKEFLRLFSSIQKGSWDHGTRKSLFALGHGISQFATETVTDSIIKGVHEQCRLTLNPSRSLVFKLFVIPGREPKRVLNSLCGVSPFPLESGPGNGSLLLVHHGGAIAREV